MLPSVNGNLLFDCFEEDLAVLIDNTDYRENSYLDYKINFSFLECAKTDPKREKHIAEFRSDVCSFANADGGYLVYGTRDEKGMAREVVGVSIPEGNTDRFELDRKNNLSSILPKMPSVRFRFLLLKSGKYLVIVHVQKDYYAPYIHVEGEIDYRIFKRIGNGKKCIGYVELKNMFNQSLSIEKEVLRFRESRIFDIRKNEDTDDFRYSQFLLLHIIPDTFVDSSHDKNVFLLKRNNRQSLSGMFGSVGCAGVSVPNVDGLRFPSFRSGEECRLYKNCIAEVYDPLNKALNIGMQPHKYPYGYFASSWVWDRIEPVVREYISRMNETIDTQRLFVCLSIVGCKDVATENDFLHDYNGKIDRDTINCAPIVFENINDDEAVELSIKRMYIEFALALGIKCSKTLQALIQEVYQ